MPKYEVVKGAGVSFPVGRVFEVDDIYPGLLQHVKQIDGGKAKAAPKAEGPETDYTLLTGLDESTYAEALKLDKLHDKEAAKAAKEAAKETPENVVATKPIDGPGENS